MTTTNMILNLPTVSITAGPLWATYINTAFTAVDEHDHTTGKGVKIPVSGININANLPMGDYSVTALGSAVLSTLTASPTTPASIHCVGGDLYWVDTGGTAVQITSGSGLNFSSLGTIGGDFGASGVTATVTYTDSSKIFAFSQSSGVPAKIWIGDLQLTYPGAGENSVTLKAQTGTASHSISVPKATPAAATSAMIFDTGGVALYKAILGTTNRVTVTEAAGSLTFSTPQNIHTGASPTFAGATFSGLTALKLVGTGASKEMVSVLVDSANTASAVVIRDGSGDFAAGTITATFIGNVTGNCSGSSGSCTGNSATATSLSGGSVAATTGSFSGIITINDTTESTAYTDGCAIFKGGVGVAKKAFFNSTLDVAGACTFSANTIHTVGNATAANNTILSLDSNYAANASYIRFVGGSTRYGYVGAGVAGSMISTGTSDNDFCIVGKQAIRFSADDGAATHGSLSNTGDWDLGVGTSANTLKGFTSHCGAGTAGDTTGLHPYLAIKILIGTTDASGDITIAHGLTTSKIVSIVGTVDSAAASGDISNLCALNSQTFAYDATNVTANMNSAFGSRAFRIIVSYIN